MGIRWAVTASGLVIAGAALVACGGDDEPSAASAPTGETRVTTATSTTTTPTTPTTTRRLSPSTDLEDVCKGKKFPAGAAYQGPPPHPTQAHGFGTLYGEYDEWPAPWPSWAPGKADAGDIQLVLCEQSADPEPTNLVCRYGAAFGAPGKPRSVKIELDVVQLKLFEVRTGKLVTEARVTGPRECPETVSVNEGENTAKSFTEVAAYAEAVRKFVLG